MRQRDVPAKQGKRPSWGRRTEAHSGGSELLGKADGVVMVIDVPSGRVIGGRNNVIIHLMAFSLHTPYLYFSILNY